MTNSTTSTIEAKISKKIIEIASPSVFNTCSINSALDIQRSPTQFSITFSRPTRMHMAIQSFHLCSITTHKFWLHPALSFSSTKKCFPSVCVKPSWTALVHASSPTFKPIPLITASPKHQRKVLEEMLQSAIWFNSLTAMVAYLRQLFFELRASLITFRFFVR